MTFLTLMLIFDSFLLGDLICDSPARAILWIRSRPPLLAIERPNAYLLESDSLA